MSLKIKKYVPKMQPVEVLNVKWCGPLKRDGSGVSLLQCSACRKQLGARRFAIAWIKDSSGERSMRLCEECGKDAETLHASDGE